MNNGRDDNDEKLYQTNEVKNENEKHRKDMESIYEQETSNETAQSSEKKSKANKLKVLGWVCIALFVAAVMNISMVDESDVAKEALKNQKSTTLKTGIVLLSNDELLSKQDYTIEHNFEQEQSKIWVWDYAAEDGDYVQVIVNGTPIGDAFMIKHEPTVLTVPSVGEVQIKGIRDGGGGITYAVKYELNNTIYFNSAPEGEFNTYTLLRSAE